MEIQLKFKVTDALFLRDPESTDTGKSIVRSSIQLMGEIGYEQFTFKKLAAYNHTTEATIYRYFANKHKLLLYILNWYWNYIFYLSQIVANSAETPKEQLQKILRIITHTDENFSDLLDYNIDTLYEIVISESSKVYLVKEVDEINKENVFTPYKDLCGYIAGIILLVNPNYQYPKSLSSTIMETAHDQQFFSMHLPKLTDNDTNEHREYVLEFLKNLVFKLL